MGRPVRHTPVTAAVAAAATVALVGLAGCAPLFNGGHTPPQPAPSQNVTPASTNPTTVAPTATTAPAPVPAPIPTYVPPPAPPPATTNPPANPGIGAEATEVVRLTNVERAKVGCAPLTVHPALTAAAQGHSQDMATNNYFSHTSQSGATLAQRVQAAGYAWSYVAENIAAGSATPAQTVQMWMNSDGHRRNILQCSTTQIGVGYARGGSYGHYWTQDFGNPR